jgi:hypothetical protein
METKITWNAQTLEGAVHKVEHEARSPDERRQILAQQAEQMKGHYEQTADELAEWQAGDFTDG